MNCKSIILTELREIYDSGRWADQDNPMRDRIPELWERINDPEEYTRLRENKNLTLLRGMTEELEDAFNDDWLPYEFFGLKLDDVRIFIGMLLDALPEAEDEEIPSTIKQCHKEIMSKSKKRVFKWWQILPAKISQSLRRNKSPESPDTLN